MKYFHVLLSLGLLLWFGSSELNLHKQFSSPKRFTSGLSRGAILGAAVPIILIGTSLCIEGYARLPPQYVFPSSPSPMANVPANKDIVIIFPGAGGPDQNIKALYNRIIVSDMKAGINRFVVCYDWSQWVGNLIRAAYDSESIGRIIGEQVAAAVNANPLGDKVIRNVHVIGVSVGAFAANNMLKTLSTRIKPDRKVYKRLTLLDPFTSKGIFGLAYGPRQFGREEYVDYFETYLNTDDPVPTTNEPLKHGVTFDVTESEARRQFKPLPGTTSLFLVYW